MSTFFEVWDELNNTDEVELTEELNLTYKEDITEEIPGEAEFKKFVAASKLPEKFYSKYRTVDGKEIFLLSITKDFLDDFIDDLEYEEWEDWDDGCHTGGVAVVGAPDEETVEEHLLDDSIIAIDQSFFNIDAPADDLAHSLYEDADDPNAPFTLVSSELSSYVELDVDLIGSYRPATYEEPAEYPDEDYSGNCEATLNLYFIYNTIINKNCIIQQ